MKFFLVSGTYFYLALSLTLVDIILPVSNMSSFTLPLMALFQSNASVHSVGSNSVVKSVILGVVKETHFPYRMSTFLCRAFHEPAPLVRVKEKKK